jgi:dolichol-phosphate mannosyltransferase
VKATIVSPTFNEAENVPRLAVEVGEAMSGIDYELLIADDDSPDRTWAVAEELAAGNPRLRVLRRFGERGLSPSVIEAFSSSTSGYVGVMDADLQHDPAILPRMIAALDSGAQIAVGSRYAEGGGTGTWTGVRRFQSRIATRLARTFLGVELSDPMSGYFIMRRSDFLQVRPQLDSSGFKILLEIIARLGPSRIAEIPYTFRERQAGQSKLSSKVVLEYLSQLWRLSSVSRYPSVRFIKFAIVGGSGTLINLCAFLVFARLLGSKDWRISALASLLANLANYISHNSWAFLSRSHARRPLLRGYFTYLEFYSLGIAISTLAFAVLAVGYRAYLHLPASAVISYPLALGIQLVAILLGTALNYKFTSRFTWRS